MFESTTLLGASQEEPAAGADSLPRRPFAWAELVARLAATRDMRSVFAEVSQGHGGSFLAAERLMDGPFANSNLKHESAVNPVGLTDGKAGEALCAEAAADAANVDREAQ